MSTATLQQVLTLEDAATFLRLPEETIERRAALGEIPGRKIEGTWRFLLSALEDWLRTPDQRSVLLSQAGHAGSSRESSGSSDRRTWHRFCY